MFTTVVLMERQNIRRGMLHSHVEPNPRKLLNFFSPKQIFLTSLHSDIALLEMSDWWKNFAAVLCFNWKVQDDFSIYGKASYEQNLSECDFYDAVPLDCLISSGSRLTKCGVGFEYQPTACKDVRIHGVLSYCKTRNEDAQGTLLSFVNTMNVNFGITWRMDIHRMFVD